MDSASGAEIAGRRARGRGALLVRRLVLFREDRQVVELRVPAEGAGDHKELPRLQRESPADKRQAGLIHLSRTALTLRAAEVRFEDLDALLRSYGFERRQPRGGSSHYVYRRGRWHLSVPTHRPHLKQYVVLDALAALEEIDAEEEVE